MRTPTAIPAALLLAHLFATPAAAQLQYSSPPSGATPPQTTSSPASPPTAAPVPNPGAPQPLFQQPQQPPSPGTRPTQPGAKPTVPAPGPAPVQSPAAAKPPQAGGVPFDYSVNLASDVFGAHLFTGAFAASGASIFNPDHVIATG